MRSYCSCFIKKSDTCATMKVFIELRGIEDTPKDLLLLVFLTLRVD
jgi:hypothetical protein